MSRARPASLPIALRLVAIVAVGVLYAVFRQHIFTIDSIYYLRDAEVAAWRDLIHPHHLLLELGLRAWWRIWEWFGWPGRAVAPIQVLNILVTLGSLVLAGRLLAILVRDRLTAACWWCLLAVLYLTWSHATQTEGVPLFAFFGTANLLWAASLPRRDRQRPVTPRTAAALAGTIVLGVLIHQSLVLWSPVLAWMLAREAPAGRRWRYGIATLAGAGTIVLACYLVGGAAATGTVEPATLWNWFTGYSEEFAGRCGSFRYFFSADLPRGIASSLLSGEPLKPYVYGGRSPDAALAVTLIPFGLLGLLFAAGFVRLPGVIRESDGPDRRALINVLLLVLLGSLFAGWWEPSNRKFWAPVVPGLVALAAVGCAVWRVSRPRLTMAATVLVVALTLSFNLFGGILPRHRARDDRQPLLTFMARSVRPVDAVVLQEDRVWQCAIYFRPQQPVHAIPGVYSDRGDPERTFVVAAIDDAVRALTSGGTLFVAASEWPLMKTEIEMVLETTLPEPVEVLRYGDLELVGDEQVLLAVRLPLG